MASTPNWSIVYPVVGNNITPLANHFANLANSVDTALTNISRPWQAYTPTVVGVNSPSVITADYTIKDNLLTYTFLLILDGSSSTTSDILTISHPVPVSSKNMFTRKSAVGTAVWGYGATRKNLVVLYSSSGYAAFSAGPGDSANADRILRGTDLVSGHIVSGTITARLA